MMRTIYELASGRIQKTLDCPPNQISFQYDPVIQAVLEGGYDDSLFYVAAGVPVAMPPQPSPSHTFNYTTKQWEDPRTLADVKAAKNNAINQARATANSSTFTFQGKQIAVDTLSRSDIDGAHGDWLTGSAPAGWPGGWKALDNTYVAIPDQATWFAFYKAMVAQGIANFSRSEALKAQLAAASTVAEVEAVADW